MYTFIKIIFFREANYSLPVNRRNKVQYKVIIKETKEEYILNFKRIKLFRKMKVIIYFLILGFKIIRTWKKIGKDVQSKYIYFKIRKQSHQLEEQCNLLDTGKLHVYCQTLQILSLHSLIKCLSCKALIKDSRNWLKSLDLNHDKTTKAHLCLRERRDRECNWAQKGKGVAVQIGAAVKTEVKQAMCQSEETKVNG